MPVMLAARRRTRWILKASPDPALVRAWAGQLRVPELVAGLLLQRGLTDLDQAAHFLAPRLADMHDPAAMPGAVEAAERLAQAVRRGRRIVIYGDYDVDGVTASAILWHTLNEAGADVHTYVPHRLEEGYGLHGESLKRVAEEHRTEAGPPLVISVDCGITAVVPAQVAAECGLDLIITDHHEADGDQLPEALLVHPRLVPGTPLRFSEADPPDAGTYPCPHLCGAGVAFKVAWQFAKVYCGSDRVSEGFKTLLLDLLSLVALGTVADVVPLVGENRLLTAHGLGRIKHTRFVGLNALIDAARLRDDRIDAYHVGFVLGPRLNACGRMGHARQAVHLLTCATPEEAAQLARFLTDENDRRRATERSIFEEACQRIELEGLAGEESRAIVVGAEGWHPGVIGIVASRLVERYHRPVVMLSFGDGNGLGEVGTAKGSARSVDQVSIHQALTRCRTYLSQFGGHAMAAGLSLPVEAVPAFRQALVAEVNTQLAPEDLAATIHIDAEVRLAECSVPAIQWLMRLAPFGRGNPTPRLMIRSARVERPALRMGARGDHLSLTIGQQRATARAVGFGMGDLADDLPTGRQVDLVFKPQVSEWRGQQRVEFHLEDVRAAEA